MGHCQNRGEAPKLKPVMSSASICGWLSHTTERLNTMDREGRLVPTFSTRRS